MTRPDDLRSRQRLPEAPRGSDGKPRGSPCRPSCRAPVNSQAHCSVCHATLRNVTDFDRHRVGGECLELAELGLVAIDDLWATPEGHARRGSLAAGLAENRRLQVHPGP